MRPTFRRLARVAATLVLAVGATACGAQQQPAGAGDAAFTPVTVKHAQGETTLKKEPKRVVVLEMGSLDTINALGLADRVVGLPKAIVPAFLKNFSDDKFADAGTLFEPNYEAINKLNPDLVVVGYRSAKTYPEMSKYFPTIDVTSKNKDFLGQVEESADVLGAAFGKQAEVDAKLADLKAQADKIKGKGADAGRGLIVMTSGGKVTAQGADSRFGAIHTLLGVAEAVPGLSAKSHGEPISFEFIAQTNPDTLFVVDRDAAIGEKGANAKEILDNAVVRNTNAWQKEKVVYLDGSRWYVVMHGLDNATAMLAEVGTGLGL